MAKPTAIEQAVLSALRRSAEGSPIETDTGTWKPVQLEAARPFSMSPNLYDTVLLSLQKGGWYRPSGTAGHGEVLIERDPAKMLSSFMGVKS